MSLNNECFESELVKHCPWGMLGVDAEGIARWMNPALAQMTGIDAEHLLGCSADTVSSDGHRALFLDTSPIPVQHPEHGERWLSCEIVKVEGPQQQTMQMHYFCDITDQVRQQEQIERLSVAVEQLTLTDDLTGMGNQRALAQNLATQVTRSRRYHNPLSLVVSHLELGRQREQLSDEEFDELVLSYSRLLRDRLRWVDFIARVEDSRFVVVLPETGEAEARKLFQSIAEDAPGTLSDELRDKAGMQVFFGVAEWIKGNDARLLIERASDDLHQSQFAV